MVNSNVFLQLPGRSLTSLLSPVFMCMMPAVLPNLTMSSVEDDFANLEGMRGLGLQKWCLTELDRCRRRISDLRVLRDLDMHSASTFESGPPTILSPALQDVGRADLFGTVTLEIEESKARIRALRSLYNWGAPINHTLPVELLMEIFAHLQPTDLRRRGRMFVLRVCRFWTDVLYHTPQFWANVVAVHHDVSIMPGWKLRRFQLALEHSSPRHLSLSLQGLPVALAKLLCSHANRISELHVDIAESVDGLNILLESDMPALTRLSISPKSNHYRSGGAWPLFSQYARLPSAAHVPALHSIRVTRQHLTASVTPASLRHIDLICCPCRDCNASRTTDRFDPLLLALAGCPSLETIHLETCLPVVAHDGGQLEKWCSPDLHAKLPRLHLLDINDCSRWAISILLSRLILPSSSLLEICTDRGFCLPGSRDTCFTNAITSADCVAFDFSDRVMETFVHGRKTLCMRSSERSERRTYDDIYAHYYTPYIEDAVKLFGTTANITSLSVAGICHRNRYGFQAPYIYPFAKAVDRWVTLLRVFPSLTHLNIGGQSDYLVVVLEALCHPGPGGHCICPSIQTLSCGWCSEACWPCVDEKLLECSSDEEDNYSSQGGQSVSPYHRKTRAQEQSKIRTIRAASEVHAFAKEIAPLLTSRVTLGAVQIQELHIQIGRCSYPRDDVSDARARRHLPAELLEDRLAALLEGLVARVVVTETD